MADYSELTLEELQTELEKNRSKLTDAEDERSFLGMQTGQHIKVAEFDRLDADIDRYTERVETITRLMEEKKAS